jgi:ribonuclease HI
MIDDLREAQQVFRSEDIRRAQEQEPKPGDFVIEELMEAKLGMKGLVNVYADGSIIGPNPSPFGGVFAYYIVGGCEGGDKVLQAKRGSFTPRSCSKEYVGSNLAESYAILMALRGVPDGFGVQIYSDSKNALGACFMNWKREYWPEWFEDQIRRAIDRLPLCRHYHLDGHPKAVHLESGFGPRGNPVSSWNVKCDEQCTALRASLLRNPHNIGGLENCE